MAKLIMIGQRILNLDTIAFVDHTRVDGVEVVTVYYEQGRRFTVPPGQPISKGTKADPHITPLNMSFRGPDARYVWDRLTELAEVWALPGEIEPGQGGGWQQRT